ncbi:MAG: transcription-repair coupling factor [Isosphaera sp.]|nr:transcription-repair coupling factor [Isosphaera sp.]
MGMSMDVLGAMAAGEAVGRVARLLGAGERVSLSGAAGSSTVLVAGAVARGTGRPVLLMLAHGDEAEAAVEELSALGAQAVLLPALEVLPGESGVSVEQAAARLRAVRAAVAWRGGSDRARVLVTTIQALMQGVPPLSEVETSLRAVRAGERLDPAALAAWLTEHGYTRVEVVSEVGEFAVRGGIVDVFPPGDPFGSEAEGSLPGGLAMAGGGVPVRLDMLGDVVERVSEIDVETMGSDRAVAGVHLAPAQWGDGAAPSRGPAAAGGGAGLLLPAVLPEGFVAVLSELSELTEQGRGYYERVIEAGSVHGPPAVFAQVQRRCAVVEVSALGGGVGGGVRVPVSPAPGLAEDSARAVAELCELATSAPGQAPLDVVVVCQNEGERSRLVEMVAAAGPVPPARLTAAVGFLRAGLVWHEPLGVRGGALGPVPAGQSPESAPALLLVPLAEVLHRYTVRGALRWAASRGGGGGVGGGGGGGRLRAGRVMDTFLGVEPGDYVVHAEHGIARYRGLRVLRARPGERSVESRLRDPGTGSGRPAAREQDASAGPGEAQEYLTLEFDGGTLVHVPAVNIDLVQKYVGARGSPPLSSVGGGRWKKQKERALEAVRDMAGEMLRVRAAREAMPGIRYPADTAWQREFEAEFPYQETDDQLAAMGEIKRDMGGARPMDRLLCGDVGYGKTELAIRAAFKAVEFGKQVAVLVPTTVLAEQHERTFRARLKAYPFRVESLSRLTGAGQGRRVLEDLAAGRVDVVIGTHRLLSKDVGFADLGLVIIDEEQRFGVEHKERLLSLRMMVDVLTLSATPIPRTLHLSMLGLRDISSLATAPADRRAVVTEVMPFNATRVGRAMARELAREGQVFYVHNRVGDIAVVADEVRAMAPGARVVVGHGQMGAADLERVMLAFMRRQADILVCTTIIESGIDIPTANTIVIDEADRFGLAELHQLRGRVGRSRHRGYCYLLLPRKRPVKEPAKRRLQAIEQFSMLGAGFKIAMRDLEIRGAGNLLGSEQSGHIAAVGYDMYCRLLDRAVRELRHEAVSTPSETSVEIGVTGTIPRGYIPSEQRRLEAYRRMAAAMTAEELDAFERDLCAAYGPVPEPAQRLIRLADLRVGARLLGVRRVHVAGPDVVIRTSDQAAVTDRLRGVAGVVTPLPLRSPSDLPEVYLRPSSPRALEPLTLLALLQSRLGAAAMARGLPSVGDGAASGRPAGVPVTKPAGPLSARSPGPSR